MVQKEVLPDPSRPPLLIDACYIEEHNIIKEELIVYLNHTHTLYKNDDALVYAFLEEALRGSSMDLTIQLYKRKNVERMI